MTSATPGPMRSDDFGPDPLDVRGGRSGRPIRVVTWNIRAAIGPGEPFPPAWWRHVRADRLERIAAFISDLQADIVTLQEVAVLTVDGDLMDQAATLATLTGLVGRYGAVHSFPLVEPENGRSIGSAMWGHAVLTRRRVERGFTRGLPRAEDDDLVEPVGSDHPLAGTRYADTEPGHREARCIVGGSLALAGDDAPAVTVATTHLTYMGREQRRNQAAAARGFADEAAGNRPLILTGDLNAAIDAPELAPALDGLADGFGAVGVPTGDPRRDSCGPQPIDHVLVRGIEVRSCRVASEAGDLSDHWPVVADLVIPGAPANE